MNFVDLSDFGNDDLQPALRGTSDLEKFDRQILVPEPFGDAFDLVFIRCKEQNGSIGATIHLKDFVALLQTISLGIGPFFDAGHHTADILP